MTVAIPVEKDVEEQLLNARKCRRRPGEVPYPFEHTNGMVDFDIWDHTFFTSCFRSLTMHRFEKHPPIVLDLGCGGGYWALEAAKQWPASTIIGFDITDLQPNLHDLEHHRHLARRVKWVHGWMDFHFHLRNLTLYGWRMLVWEFQRTSGNLFLRHEISRVMKPDAILEVIEEDLIFPCTTIPPEPPMSPTLDLDLSLLNFNASSSSTLSHEAFPNSYERRPPPSPLRTKLQELTKSKTVSKTQLAHAASLLAETSFTSQSSSGSEATLIKKHPQDHSRIKASWDAMLSNRFLSPKLLSVLPFYLSTFFTDVQTHPPYKVPLPPNSNSIPPLRSRHSAESFRPSSRGKLDAPFDLKLSSLSRSANSDGCSIRAMYSMRDLGSPHRWSTMHLAKTVNTVAACKDPIWREYEKLFFDDFVVDYADTDVTLRQVFDRDWNSWHNDMHDRMCMRDRLDMSLAWPETPGDRPDCRKWRSDFDPRDSHSLSTKGPPPKMYHDPGDLCRSMRVFVARKL